MKSSERNRFLLAALWLILAAGRAGAQQFTEIFPGLPEKFLPCVAVGDYDGDGDLDVLVAASGSHDIAFSTIYKNTGGTFTDSGIALLGLARASAAWGDFDRDGDLDLAMTGVVTGSTLPTTVVYRNNGGTFTAVPGSFFNVFAGNVAWGDYDNDGDLDLIVNGADRASADWVPVTRLYRNDGGVFTSVPHPFPNCTNGALAWGDYDNDGDLDLVMTGTDRVTTLAAIWRNDGGGTFTNAGAGLPGMDLGFTAWGDYDNDGDLDLLFGGDPYITPCFSRIYRNDGGTFTDAAVGFQSLLWSSGAWGDYDNDGDLDAMIMGYDPVAQVQRSILYRNDGGTFVDSGAIFSNLYLGTLSWLDYDNDGKVDLLLAGHGAAGADVLRIYRNNTLTPNSAPGAPTNLTVTGIGPNATLSWSPANDDHTPSAGLSYNLRVGTSPGGSQIVSSESGTNGYRRLAAMGNAQSGLTATLNHLVAGTTYYWSVQAVDGAFMGSAFATEGSWSTATSVGDPAGEGSAVPHQFALLANQPNPFGAATRITFEVPIATPVTLAIYDAAGRHVRTLVDDARRAGVRDVTWDGTDMRGKRLPTGVYFYQMHAGSFTKTRRMVMVP